MDERLRVVARLLDGDDAGEFGISRRAGLQDLPVRNTGILRKRTPIVHRSLVLFLFA